MRTTTFGSSPGYVADWGSVSRATGRQIDFALVPDIYRPDSFIVKANGNAAANATSITVDALPKAIKAGQLLYFGQAGENVRVTADAAAGATSITVDALPQQIEDNDEATVAGVSPKVVKSGTIMCELSGGKIVPRKFRPGSETSTGLLVGDAEDGAKQDALSGHGLIIGGVVYKALLPERAESGFDTWIGEIQSAGPGLRLETYSDSRAA